MTLAEPSPVTPRCQWDPRDEFLLLPGDGLILATGGGVVTFFDHRAHALMGREPGCQCGDQLDVIWPELADALEDHSMALEHQGPIETRMICGASRRTVRLFRTDQGVGIVLLSDESDSESACNQRLLMLQRILHHVRDAVIVTTAEPVDSPGPVMVYANPAALRQTGYTLGEILGRSPRMFQGPETDREALLTFHQAMRCWQPTRQTILNYRKDGSTFWVEIDIAPLENSDGWHSYWVSVQRECALPMPSLRETT